MPGPIRRRSVAAAAAVALLGSFGAFAAVQASASAGRPASQPAGLDHLLCYPVPNAHTYHVPPLVLKNQFNAAGFVPTVTMIGLRHCNPVAKKVGGKVFSPANLNADLLCFPITAPAQAAHTVQATNQFGKADLLTGQPNSLCLPTWKSLTGPPNQTPNQPPGLDHFVCYPVTYADATRFTIPVNVSVKDQFANVFKPVTVGDPVVLCLPTTKIAGGVTYKAQQSRAHLVCFVVNVTKHLTLFDQNQFGTDHLGVGNADRLCLPSFKQVIN